MANLGLVLLVFAFVFACISVRWNPIAGWNFLSLAFACFIAAQLFGSIGRVTGLH